MRVQLVPVMIIMIVVVVVVVVVTVHCGALVVMAVVVVVMVMNVIVVLRIQLVPDQYDGVGVGDEVDCAGGGHDNYDGGAGSACPCHDHE